MTFFSSPVIDPDDVFVVAAMGLAIVLSPVVLVNASGRRSM
jgi:hypothetical protein